MSDEPLQLLSRNEQLRHALVAPVCVFECTIMWCLCVSVCVYTYLTVLAPWRDSSIR
jgi:hypothetical protein